MWSYTLFSLHTHVDPWVTLARLATLNIHADCFRRRHTNKTAAVWCLGEDVFVHNSADVLDITSALPSQSPLSHSPPITPHSSHPTLTRLVIPWTFRLLQNMMHQQLKQQLWFSAWVRMYLCTMLPPTAPHSVDVLDITSAPPSHSLSFPSLLSAHSPCLHFAHVGLSTRLANANASNPNASPFLPPPIN